MRKLTIVLLFISCNYLFPSGRIETPTTHIDIGELDFTENNTSNSIYLPYTKPMGLERIFLSSDQGLIIDRIVVDGRTINPRRTFLNMTSYHIWDRVPWDFVEKEEAEIFMPMSWQVNNVDARTYDESLSEGIYFRHFTRNGRLREAPVNFRIPFGSNEVIITYRVRLANNYDDNRIHDYLISEEAYSVRFTVKWPEVRVADSDGRIAAPNSYINLGIQRINTEGIFEVELPFEFPDNMSFTPRINNRWIRIYELIGDGILINGSNLNRSERNNITQLLTFEQIEENSNVVKMIWHLQNDNLVFYVNSLDPPIKYNIPKNTRVIYLTYDVLFAGTSGSINFNRRTCVRFEVYWN